MVLEENLSGLCRQQMKSDCVEALNPENGEDILLAKK